MSAIVCGKRSSIFEDNHNLGVNLAANPPVSKRIRCSSSSPVRFSHPTPTPTLPSFASSDLIQHLRAIFPHMDHKVTLLSRSLFRSLYILGNSNLLPFYNVLIEIFSKWLLFYCLMIRFDLMIIVI